MSPDTITTAQHAPILSGYLTVAQLADELRRDIRTLRRWRTRRCGPPCKRIGNRLLYKRVDVLAWIDSQEVA